MDLDFTAEQDELRAGIRTVLDKACPPTRARALTETGTADDSLWNQMTALGWPALTVPEATGGLGLGAVELAVLAEELGRAIAPGPLFATAALFIPALLELGDVASTSALLDAVAQGDRTGTVADGRTTMTATPSPTGITFDGVATGVIDATSVSDVVLIGRDRDALRAAVVRADDVAIEPVAAFDRTRGLATVRVDRLDVVTAAVLPATSAHSVDRVVEMGAAAIACSMVGTAQQIFDVILDYAKERTQFGVPIGSFQAIKHKFADLLVTLERARATAYFAALTIAEDDPRRAVAVSVAKAAAGDLADRATKEGIQVLGGIGFTWEHDMHLYVRRLSTDATLLGSAADHRAVVADALFG